MEYSKLLEPASNFLPLTEACGGGYIKVFKGVTTWIKKNYNDRKFNQYNFTILAS